MLHAKALHGNPFDGHTLGPVITELEQLTGIETRRIHVDKGYRGHNHKEKFRVWISGQVRRVPRPIRREMKRRAAVEPVIADMESLTGIETRRTHVDKGYRGHNHPHKFRVWISGQVRRVTAPIRREMRRRAAVEPVIGHLKAEHRMNRNYLKGRDGDRINAVLAAAGYNFGLLLRWLAKLLRALFAALSGTPAAFHTA